VIRNSGLAVVVGVLAALIGLPAYIGASAETWAGLSLLTTCGVLMLAAISAVCRTSHERPRFVGFAVFGWGYFALARWYSYHQGPMPTVCWLSGAGDLHNDLLALPAKVRIAHDAWALAFAVIGSTLAGLLFKHLSARDRVNADETSAGEHAAAWWRRPAFAGLLGFGLVAMSAALAGTRREPESWAGAAFLLTWALLGVAVLGAVCARGWRRDAYVGAASFGIGYLILAFGPVVSMTLPTDHLLNAVFRLGDPTTARERIGDDLINDNESQRVRMTLHQPITLHFPENTSLKIVLDHIKNAIRGSLGRDLVFHAHYEDFLWSYKDYDKAAVRIDRANIPAEDALRLCLGQVGLTYRVQSGYVRIMPNGFQALPFDEDPVMIAGHSLLALVVAGIGGVGALFVTGRRGR
jgi:hypothetical protein